MSPPMSNDESRPTALMRVFFAENGLEDHSLELIEQQVAKIGGNHEWTIENYLTSRIVLLLKSQAGQWCLIHVHVIRCSGYNRL